MPENQIISWENFLKGMIKKYRNDFLNNVHQHSNQNIDLDKAEEYFRTFVKALYYNRIEGIGTGYGDFYEGGAEGEKGRQNLVDAFHQETLEFIRAFGPLAAKGSTLLWSSAGIGRFAVDDRHILKQAGVTDENAQPLDQTAIGKLWDRLKITTEDYKQIGYIWDSQYNVWASVSKEIATNAKGEVHVFVPKNIAAYTIFWNVELPELRKNMAEFTQKPQSEQVTKITIHNLTDDALKMVNEAADEDAKKQVMLEPSSWQNLDFSEASLDVPNFSDKQKKLLQDSNPLLLAQMEKYVSSNKTAGTITISKLTEIARRWRDKASTSRTDIELYRKIVDKYGHFGDVPFDIVQKIAKGQATDNEIRQYADKLVKEFQKQLSTKKPGNDGDSNSQNQIYDFSDMEIITHLLYENYTQLQKASSIEMSTKVISKTEIENLLKKTFGNPTLTGFSNLDRYSQKLSAGDMIRQFGLDYQYQDASDQGVPFIYYVTSPMTDDIKNNAKIPLDPTVKDKLEAIATDGDRDEDDQLKKMAKELTNPKVYHELTPNNDNNLPEYGTQTDGKKSYANMLRTTYSTSSAQLSPGATIRAKGPNGENFKIADWDGLSWTLSPQSSEDLPSWLKNKGRAEDRLDVDTELKAWKSEGDRQIVPPTKVPGPVRAFMEHHFQSSLVDITIQKVNNTENDDSTSTVIKFKPGEYDDTTENGLKKIAKKLGDAVNLRVSNTNNQPDVSKTIKNINNELPQKSVSIKNDLMMLRRPKISFTDTVNAAMKFKPKYTTGRPNSVSPGARRPSSRR
ncbi:MAG: hypothetical protein F6K08_26590 [Okeania sp. SIO1H6]|nr:hypothetical protein [Okeania sp. SIO1H6]